MSTTPARRRKAAGFLFTIGCLGLFGLSAFTVLLARDAQAAHQAAPIRILLDDAVAVVLAKVSAVEEKDGGKLRAYKVEVLRVLRGDIKAKKITLVEILGGSTAPAYLKRGQRAVVLVAAAPKYSYLRKHFPKGHYYDVVAGRDGVIQLRDNGDLSVIESTIENSSAIGSRSDHGNDDLRIDLALQEIASKHPRLVTDALIELRSVESLRGLNASQARTIGAALVDPKIDAAVRAGLIDVLGAKDARAARPMLEKLKHNDPLVLAATLRARAALGKAADAKEVGRYFATSDPAMRAAAVRGLALLDHKDTTARLGRLATDDVSELVRLAAIESLGERADPAGMEWLRKSFENDARVIKQATARAILAIGGDACDNAFVELSLKGKSKETRTYAVALLLTKYPRKHPVIMRIENGDPGPHVRELLEHGLEPGGTHQH